MRGAPVVLKEKDEHPNPPQRPALSGVEGLRCYTELSDQSTQSSMAEIAVTVFLNLLRINLPKNPHQVPTEEFVNTFL